jgi:hypothetical protein
MVRSSRGIAKGGMLQAFQGPEERQTSSELWRITVSHGEENRGRSKYVGQTGEAIWKSGDNKPE